MWEKQGTREKQACELVLLPAVLWIGEQEDSKPHVLATPVLLCTECLLLLAPQCHSGVWAHGHSHCMVEVATTRGLAALSARVADALTGSEPKLMLLPHPKCSCCWGAPTCSKKGTFGSSGSSVSLPICWTEEFRNLYDSFPLQKFSVWDQYHVACRESQVCDTAPLSNRDGTWAPQLDFIKAADPPTFFSCNGDHMGFVQYKQRDGS